MLCWHIGASSSSLLKSTIICRCDKSNGSYLFKVDYELADCWVVGCMLVKHRLTSIKLVAQCLTQLFKCLTQSTCLQRIQYIFQLASNFDLSPFYACFRLDHVESVACWLRKRVEGKTKSFCMLHALNIFLHFPFLLLPCFSIVFVLRLELPFLQVQLLRLETLVVQGCADASIRNQLRVKLLLEFQQL